MTYLESSNSEKKIPWWLPGGEGGRDRELLFTGHRSSVGEDEKVLEMNGCNG